MNRMEHAEKLLSLVEEGTSPFHVAASVERQLKKAGFQRLAMGQDYLRNIMRGWASDPTAQPHDIWLKIRGHSRGGAVANLLASYADGASGVHGAIPSAGDVRAYTFATPNCKGAEKVRRILGLFPDRESYRLTAFGDSRGDREMLAMADEAHYKPFRK